MGSSALAARVLRAADACDFGDALDHAAFQRPDRHGVRTLIVSTTDLGEDLLGALLAWRLGQYLLTGFYDERAVAELGWTGEPRETVHAQDLHALAIDRRGRILCYVTLKQPDGLDSQPYASPARAAFPCEEVHGRAWQNVLDVPADLRAASVWELARFCRDQRRGPLDAAARRAVPELALAAARFIRHPARHGVIRAGTGDFDPNVALRNVRYFFIPVATFPAHDVRLADSDPLAPRYRNAQTAPFLASAADIDEATYLRWVDIDLALSCDDREAARRLRALRSVVSIRESSLKRPQREVDFGPYPEAALTSASSRDASLALWTAANAHQLPRWEGVLIGPGDAVPLDRVAWVVEGFIQAKTRHRGELTHLASIGADVAYVPRTDVTDVASLEAAMPVRALVTDQASFEDFWSRRQAVFETATASLYGEVSVWSMDGD